MQLTCSLTFNNLINNHTKLFMQAMYVCMYESVFDQYNKAKLWRCNNTSQWSIHNVTEAGSTEASIHHLDWWGATWTNGSCAYPHHCTLLYCGEYREEGEPSHVHKSIVIHTLDAVSPKQQKQILPVVPLELICLFSLTMFFVCFFTSDPRLDTNLGFCPG